MKSIVHLSKTPLVGSPGKLSELCRRAGYQSICIVQQDYPENGGLRNKFMKYSVTKNNDSNWNTLLDKIIYNADIIHLHNDYDFPKGMNFNQKTKFIYQVHSPLREGPLFLDKSNFIDINFERKLVIGQYHTRLYPNFDLVPNLVLDNGSSNFLTKYEKIRIMYSPTHKRDGRWNNKFSQNLMDTLEYLDRMGKIELIIPVEPLDQDSLLLLRKSCHISIDEISTGSYHQVSLEGLCAGNVVINGSDFMSNFALSNMIGAKELPPFYICNEDNISDKLIDLVYNRDLIINLQEKSSVFYQEFLNPYTLFSKSYNKIYQECLLS